MNDRRRERAREEKDPADGRSIPRGTDEHADEHADTASDGANRADDAHEPRSDEALEDERDRRPN